MCIRDSHHAALPQRRGRLRRHGGGEMCIRDRSLFFAFASLLPDMMVLLFFIIPVKVKWLAYLDAAWLLYGLSLIHI